MICSILLFSSLLLGFRVGPSENLNLVANNAEFWVNIFVSGFAFSLVGSHANTRERDCWHIHLLAIIVTMGATTGALLIVKTQPIIVFVAASLSGILALFASRAVMKARPWGNFVFAAWLIALVLMWIFSYLSSLSSTTWFHQLNPYLLGKITTNPSYSWTTPGLILALTLVYLITKTHAEAIALTLLGIAITIAGPIVLLGWLAPRLALSNSVESTRVNGVLSGVVGASLFCFLVASSQKLLGGYSPALGFTVMIVSIPFLLRWNQSHLQNIFPSKLRNHIESLLIVISALILALVLLHLNGFIGVT